jgi:PAS domain S-box-containing protein
MLGRRRKAQGGESPYEALAGLAGAGAALAAAACEGEHIFRTIFEHVAVGIWQSTPDGRYLRVNPRCAEIMGYDTPEAAVAAVSDIAQQIYVDPAERDLFKSKLAAEGRVSDFIARHRKRDGTVYWVRLSAVAVPGPDGKPAFYIGSGEEISELIETQEQLRAAERDYREMWENAAEGIYRSSPEGRQLRANPALVAFNGYASEAEMLAAVRDIAKEWYVEPGRRDVFKRLLREKGRVHNFESEVYRHKTRERVWVSENAWEVKDAAGRLLYYEGTVRDITARKLAEWKIRESEERFRDYADTASDWFWESDTEHRFTFLSSSDRRPNVRDHAVIGKTRWEYADDLGDDPAKWEHHRAVLARREPFRNFVFRMRNAKGEPEYISASGKPVFDAQGEFQGYRGSARRITEQVRQQERLRESEERFRDFADTASDWFWETDAEHRFSFISESDGMQPNGNRVRAIGRTRWEMAADVESEPGKWSDYRRRLERREPFRDFKYRVPTPNGRLHVVAVSGKPKFAPDGTFLGYRGSGRLITEQVRQSEALLESEARFRDFAATASDWFWETDEAHRFTYFSSSARIGPGRPVEGLGKTRFELGLDLIEEPEKWRKHRAVLDRREPFRDFVYLVRMANGETHYTATSGTPVYGPDGRFRGYRGSSRLVTEAIRQEERLREAKTQAEAASATKSAFLANMSHELRTPLNAIIGFSEIMNREMFGKIGIARYTDYIKDIGDSAQHLLRLIEDILDLSKAEAGKMELEEAEIDLAASIHSACLMLRERAKRGGVALIEDVSADIPRLYGDRRRIRQVLLNLVSNAVKFTPHGGAVRVAATCATDGGLVLSVTDTGIGIEAGDISRVFEPFVQLGRDKGVSGEGTGLGLPLCKELVEMHGGTISLSSQPGVGTRVTAAFPPGRTAPRRAAA